MPPSFTCSRSSFLLVLFIIHMLNDFIRSDPFLSPGKQIIVFVATRHHVEYLQAIFSAMFATPQSVAIYVRSQAN